MKVFPEIMGAGNEKWRGAYPSACRINHGRRVRIGELDLDQYNDEFLLIAVVEFGLLRTVVGDPLIVVLDDLEERCEERDGKDIRTGFGGREKLRVLFEDTGVGADMALAEQIGFANCLV